MDIKAPCKVYWPREGKEPKVLTANTQKELEGLLRIGWKTEDQSPSDERNPPALPIPPG